MANKTQTVAFRLVSIKCFSIGICVFVLLYFVLGRCGQPFCTCFPRSTSSLLGTYCPILRSHYATRMRIPETSCTLTNGTDWRAGPGHHWISHAKYICFTAVWQEAEKSYHTNKCRWPNTGMQGFWVQCKMLVLNWVGLNSLGPEYLKDTLRVSWKLFSVSYCYRDAWERAFLVEAPTISSPRAIANFLTRLHIRSAGKCVCSVLDWRLQVQPRNLI